MRSATAALLLLIATAIPASAAWQYFFTYFGGNAWSPIQGEAWGQMIRTGTRYLQAETYSVRWNWDRINWLRARPDDPQSVFHIFEQNSGGCASTFSFNQYWWTNVPNAYKYEKNANCVPTPWGPLNEVRFYYPRWSILSYPDAAYYYGGEFETGYMSEYGETNYDTYYAGSKEWHGKWCFRNDDSMYTNGRTGPC